MKRRFRALLSLLILCALAPSVRAANGTLSPAAFQYVFDVNGNPVSGAKICTYLAGTTTAATTWSEVTLTTPNTNPILADSAGRWLAYLQTGQSYKFVFQDGTGTVGNCDGAAIKTVDNIAAVPGSAANLDLTGIAGETLTAGQVVYLSDGSGGKVAGTWYKADSANPYSSTLNEIGMVPATITIGNSGTIRSAGQVTGLTSLTPGALYYVGTAGALTATAPANSRPVGQADTTTSIILTPNPALPAPLALNNGIVGGRLTLTTLVPVTTADVLAATTLRYTPFNSNLIALYSGTAWATQTTAEITIAVPATTSQMYDVFAFNNAGVVTLELLAWTNDTTRATALVLQDGVLVKTGALTRRYLGSMRTTAVSGQTEDSTVKRYVWNEYNRVPRVLRRLETTASWPYSTPTLRQANGAAANQLDVIVGVAEVALSATVQAGASSTAQDNAYVAIGEDSTTTGSANCIFTKTTQSISGITTNPFATLTTYPAIGRHTYVWLEWAAGGGTMTWLGVTAGSAQTGISGVIPG